MKQWIDSLLNTPGVKALPIMTHPGIEMLGKTVREAVTSGVVHYQAVKALSETYPEAACPMIMDLTVEAEAFGAPIRLSDHEIPTVSGRLLTDAESVHRLEIPSLSAGRVPEFLLANLLCASELSDRCVMAGCIGPFSLAGRLYDMNEIMMAIYLEPEAMEELLDKCTQFITKYCKAIKRTGVSGVIMAEPAAGLLSGDDCRDWSARFVRRIVDEVQDDTFTVILHNCGDQGQCIDAMVSSGARGLHFGNQTRLDEVIDQIPQDLLVMGNLDPVGIFKQASPEKVREASEALLAKLGSHRNFVISSGCDLPPQVPAANLKAFFQAVEDYNASRS